LLDPKIFCKPNGCLYAPAEEGKLFINQNEKKGHREIPKTTTDLSVNLRPMEVTVQSISEKIGINRKTLYKSFERMRSVGKTWKYSQRYRK
jgi:predicted glycosyl hydrolase (DUF1957 family)